MPEKTPPKSFPAVSVQCGASVSVQFPDGGLDSMGLGEFRELLELNSAGGEIVDETWDETSRTTTTIDLGGGVTATQITSVTLERPDGSSVTLNFN